jgi:hypothetical protein
VAFRKHLNEAALQLQFQRDLFTQLEAIELDKVSKKASPKKRVV